MADQDHQRKLQQLRDEVKAAEEMKKCARAELEQLKASVIKKRSKYLRLKMENDQLDIDVELQFARLKNEGEREDNFWYKIENELSDQMGKMDAALSGIDAERAETNAMIGSHFRSIRDIPRNYSEEALELQAIELKQDCDANLAVIHEQEQQIADQKLKLAADATLARKDSDNADAFLKELKIKVIELETSIRRRNRTTSK